MIRIGLMDLSYGTLGLSRPKQLFVHVVGLEQLLGEAARRKQGACITTSAL